VKERESHTAGFDISELRVTEGQLQQCHMRVLAFKAEQEQTGRQHKNKSSLAELLASFFAQVRFHRLDSTRAARPLQDNEDPANCYLR
jgi:hypothetical protein